MAISMFVLWCILHLQYPSIISCFFLLLLWAGEQARIWIGNFGWLHSSNMFQSLFLIGWAVELREWGVFRFGNHWKSNKWWNSFLTCPKFISSFSSTHEFCFSVCILSKHMLKGSKARPKSQSWTLPTDTNWIDWDWDDFPGETSYQKRIKNVFFVFGM